MIVVQLATSILNCTVGHGLLLFHSLAMKYLELDVSTISRNDHNVGAAWLGIHELQLHHGSHLIMRNLGEPANGPSLR